MGTIVIDGRVFTGNSVTILNGKVIIDGVPQDGSLSGVIEIKVTEGVLGSLRTDASVSCGAVIGDVDAGGSVNCERVDGNVRAGGSVNCRDVGGSVMAGGSISRR